MTHNHATATPTQPVTKLFFNHKLTKHSGVCLLWLTN